jgi:hypothetical protein
MAELEIHEAALIFPPMSEEDYASLKAGIRRSGQRETIKLLGGKVLDGRHRLRACQELGRKPRTEDLPPDTDPVDYVYNENYERRHLNESQKAMVAVEMANFDYGGDRRSDDFKGPRGPLKEPHASQGDTPNMAGDNGDREKVTQAEAAKKMGIHARTVKRAQVVKDHGIPELAAMVKGGEVTVTAAANLARLSKAEQEEAVDAGPKEVKKAAARAKQQGRAKAQPANKRKPRKDRGAPRATEEKVADALTSVQDFVKSWELGGIKAVVSKWEDRKRWQFCDELERLARTLKGYAAEIRALMPGLTGNGSR